MFAFR